MSALVPFQSLHLVATTPDGMAKAQQSMIEWCAHKTAVLTEERTGAVENREVDKRNKWRHLPWHRRVVQIQKQLTFYEKVKAALEAGYYLLPPLPMDVFAIRTDRKRPTPGKTFEHWPDHTQRARLLPPGEGRYVSPHPTIWKEDELYRDGGDVKTREVRWAKEFRKAEFPLVAIRPEILAATDAAMQKKVFDRLGLVAPDGFRRDPMIIGEVLRPHVNRSMYERPVTFFIGWWFDLEDF